MNLTLAHMKCQAPASAGLPPVFNSTYFVYFSLFVVPKRFVC